LLAVCGLGFLFPQVLIGLWPWALTPLAARLLVGWGALIGVGNVAIAGDPRWSAWRVGVESIGLWHLLFLAGAMLHAQDFTGGRFFNWYVLSVIAVLALMGALYAGMALGRRARPALSRERAGPET
jgi:hypothetical protein